MTSLAYSIETPAGTFFSFREAAEAGYPVACEWFVECDRPADDAHEVPGRGLVPCCDRCWERVH